MNMPWDYHENKDVIRSFVLPEKPVKHGGIFLAGSKCMCINKFVENNLANNAPNNSILLIERLPNVFLEMKQNSPKLPSIKCIHGKLEKLKLNHKIDYAFLDFLGGLSNPISMWMNQMLSPNLIEGATVAITQIFARRGNKIIPQQQTEIYKPEAKNFRMMYSMFNHHTQQVLMLIHRIFHLWDFDIETNNDDKIPRYRDVSHYMTVFKLINFRKSQNNYYRSL